MKKKIIALIAGLSLSLCLVSVSAFAELEYSTGGISGAEQSSFSETSNQGGIGEVPTKPDSGSGQNSSSSGNTGAGEAGSGDSGASQSTYSQAVSSAPSNPLTRFFNAVANWIRQQFAPWMQSVALPWLMRNWKWVAIGCGALIVLRMLIGVFSRTSRKRTHSGKK